MGINMRQVRPALKRGSVNDKRVCRSSGKLKLRVTGTWWRTPNGATSSMVGAEVVSCATRCLGMVRAEGFG